MKTQTCKVILVVTIGIAICCLSGCSDKTLDEIRVSVDHFDDFHFLGKPLIPKMDMSLSLDSASFISTKSLSLWVRVQYRFDSTVVFTKSSLRYQIVPDSITSPTKEEFMEVTLADTVDFSKEKENVYYLRLPLKDLKTKTTYQFNDLFLTYSVGKHVHAAMNIGGSLAFRVKTKEK